MALTQEMSHAIDIEYNVYCHQRSIIMIPCHFAYRTFRLLSFCLQRFAYYEVSPTTFRLQQFAYDDDNDFIAYLT